MGVVILRRELLPAAALAGCRRRRAAGFPGYAFVANREGRAVAAVDLSAFAVARHIRLPAGPSQVFTGPALPYVYALTPEGGSLHEIAADTLTLGRSVSVGRLALVAHFGAGHRCLWVLCGDPPSLACVGLESMRVEARVALPARAADFDLASGGLRAAVAIPSGPAVAAVDLQARRVEWVKSCPGSVSAVRCRFDGRLLIAANPAQRRLTLLRASDGLTVAELPLAVRPEHFCFKTDGGQLFLSGEGMDAVVVVYPYQTEVAETLLAGRAPGFLAVSTNPGYLFVANPTSSSVTILDIQTRQVIGVASVGAEPAHITITPDQQYALVLNQRSGDMAVLRLASITSRRTKSAPLFTMIPVGSRPVWAVVRRI